ncbi:AAA family ATPase [Rhodopseudomonas palustris]|uniref:Metallophosphoesterase n=1 Tax=Rhodopseudomonas palustris TaxID=1076 RepID=A0A418V429_RHOPL|nr:AAA family ATPase [Rhodopseudomonas palustris]RJF70879.1 metallophosphoesterase [Rhodopseudomonas palustris]
MLIRNISRLQNAGILAARTSKTPSIDFKKFNLIYGFNGSGKSTLSRCLSAIQSTSSRDLLPNRCEIELVTDTGQTLRIGTASASGIRLAVFNEDFVNLNLQWSAGKARPVFYIGEEQAEAAEGLRAAEAAIPAAKERLAGAERLVATSERQISAFKRDLARTIAQEIRLTNRKYEAPQLTTDYATLELDAKSLLDETILSAVREVCRREEAMPALLKLDFDTASIRDVLLKTGSLMQETPSLTIIPELETHSEMLRWVHEGAEYHGDHDLNECLLCGGPLSAKRKELLASALDEGFAQFQNALTAAKQTFEKERIYFQQLALAIPSPKDIIADRREAYDKASNSIKDALSAAIAEVFDTAISDIEEKLARPTLMPDPEDCASVIDRADRAFSLIESWFGVLNLQIDKHNEACESFLKRQEEAQLALRRDHLFKNKARYDELLSEATSAANEFKAAKIALEDIQSKVRELSIRVKEHGRAAEKINRLIEAYLGHKELSIVSVDNGYEIHRRGRPIEGSPSEGEKTAIAICYFLSTLESDGLSIQDCIVVVDDPISSLDSKALNYACALLISRLGQAAQVFVMTHNQNCMNEFKKAWSRFHRPRNKATLPSACFLFLDVRLTPGTETRATTIVEMSRLLREYDSEYHYLVDHVLKFEASSDADYEYAYMMPNVLRRVLDVFLAFRCPGSDGFSSKMERLRKDFHKLDGERVSALERLVQLESHSDSLDDLIGFSSMTLEESKAATKALIGLMETVDPSHLAALRGLCRT